MYHQARSRADTFAEELVLELLHQKSNEQSELENNNHKVFNIHMRQQSEVNIKKNSDIQMSPKDKKKQYDDNERMIKSDQKETFRKN